MHMLSLIALPHIVLRLITQESFVFFAWGMKMRFTYLKFTQSHELTMNGSDYTCKTLLSLTISEDLRHEN